MVNDNWAQTPHMSRTVRIICIALAMLLTPIAAISGPPAELVGGGAVLSDSGGAVSLRVDISKTVPWRLKTLASPARIVVDFGEVDWSKPPTVASASVSDIRVGRYRPGWSRMVILLREPLAIETAEMTTADDGQATLFVTLRPTTAEDFRQTASPPEPEAQTALIAVTPKSPDRIRVALDPGHGGIDPGAEHSGLAEADLMLTFARALKERLVRTGRFDVILTREEDVFVPLEHRIGIAQGVQADVFISLHADSLEEGSLQTSGVTAYTLSDSKADKAAIQLAERHAAQEILAGVDLSGAGDDVSMALIELAQRETTPRSEALAGTIISAITSAGLEANTRPHRHGGFSVLKSPDIPSVLLELGYMSHPDDRGRLNSPEWQENAQQAVIDALLLWWDEDQLRRDAMRR